MTDDEITERLGCDRCTDPNPVWNTMHVTDDGYVVSTCDCGRAEICTQSATKDAELWEHDVKRDEQGRFATGDADE